MTAKRNKQIGTSVMILLIMACFIPANLGAFAPGDGRPDRGHHEKGHHRSALGIWRNPQMVQKLGLTAEQIKKVRVADFTFHEKQLPLKAQLESLHLQMEKAFSDDIVDNAAVLSLAEKISVVKGDLFVQKIESRLAFEKILNVDQIEQLKMHAMHQKRDDQRRAKNCTPKHHSVNRPEGNTLSDELKE